MDVISGESAPKRGDILQTNIGSSRERTWLILRSRHMKRAKRPHRYYVFAARWWELEPEIRVRLHASAVRNGGQVVWNFKRYAQRKRKVLQWL